MADRATVPRLDAGAFVAGLEYAAETEATVLGKPSSAYFAAALTALDADPELTWMVGDDIEGDILGASNHGLSTVLVRTGKFRPDDVERSRIQPDGIVSSLAAAARLARAEPLMALRVGVDLIEIERIRARARSSRRASSARCFTEAERALLRLEAEPAAALRGALRRQGGGRKGARLGRLFHVAEIEIRGRPKPGVHLSGRTAAWAEKVNAGRIELSMTHSRELAAAVAVVEDE